jgi:dihydrodipicolinate synthase/N-acetylneuraminate lyase
MIHLLLRSGGLPAFKAMMKWLGLDCGPVRPPLLNPGGEELAEIKRALDAMKFFA